MATITSDAISHINSSSSATLGISNENVNSPRHRRNPRNNFSSPWANVVRGESDSVPAAPSSPSSSVMMTSKDQSPPDSEKVSFSVSPDISTVEIPPDISDSSNSNAAKSKKPAWNKPSNGVGVVDVSPVMGAVSWPALSESAKASPKSSSESLKALSDGSGSASQGPVVAASPQKPVNANANQNSAPSHPYTKQRSFKRGGGGGGSANGGSSQQHPPPPMVEIPQNHSPKTAPVVPGTSPKDAAHKSHNWEGGQKTGLASPTSTGIDHPQQRSSYRRGGGGHHRGDGSNHYNHGNRREQDRANHDSNVPHRGFNGRDGHLQHRVNQRNFVRPMQPSTAPFVSTPPVRPFGNPLGFPDMVPPLYYVSTPSPDSLRGVPFIHPAPFAMIVPAPDPVRAVLIKQIEYYFSPENLCKDIFLRRYMDGQGWVPISLIANFNRVKQFAPSVQFILDCVRTSTVVEVQGDKIRKRNDWMNWTLSQPAVPESTQDTLTTRIQNVKLEEGANGSSSESDGQEKPHH